MTTTTALTLTEALTLPPDLWVDVLAGDLRMTPTTWAAVGDAWAWLLGCTESTDPEELHAVRCEALNDGELTIALCSPMPAFLEWFRRSEWEFFASGAEAEDDDWAWALMERVKAEISRMGPLSREISLVSLMAGSSLQREGIWQITDITRIIDSLKKSGD